MEPRGVFRQSAIQSLLVRSVSIVRKKKWLKHELVGYEPKENWVAILDSQEYLVGQTMARDIRLRVIMIVWNLPIEHRHWTVAVPVKFHWYRKPYLRTSHAHDQVVSLEECLEFAGVRLHSR